MKASELFLKLKKDMEKYKSKIRHAEESSDEKNNSRNLAMSRYNLENFNEIINSSFEWPDEEIDEKILKDFQDRIDHFFRAHAPGDEEFKEFIKAVSTYLVFIAKKPLHPPGIVFSNGAEVYKKGNVYFCTGKSIFIKDKLSLCKYCAAEKASY